MTKTIKTKWEITDKRFVAYIDILGFKDWVARSTHEEIYEKLLVISDRKISLENLSKKEGITKYIGNGDIYTVSFSDSIIIFSKNDDIENFGFFILTVGLFFENAIRHEIPMKGGVAYGKVSLNKSEQIYFGQAIIDAYLMEEDVNYFGITLHNSVDKYIDDNIEDIKNDNVNYRLFECKTPLKSGNIEHRNIDWFKMLNLPSLSNDKIEQIEKIIKSFKLTSSGSARRYVDNTLEVLKSKKTRIT